MDNDEHDDGVGSHLRKIRAAQAKALDDASEDEDEDEGEDMLERWKEAKLSHQSSLSQQGFTQDLSQPLQSFCQQPSPALETIAYNVPLQRRAPPALLPLEPHIFPPQTLTHQSDPSDYQYRNDPACAFAPGGPMAPGGQRYNGPSNYGPPRVPTPSSNHPSRAASPASSTGDGLPKKKKAKQNVQEEEQLQADIEKVINSFRPEYRCKIVCEEERDLKNVDDKELYNVARWLPINKPVPRRFDLATFNSKQIRRLALSCGVKGGGNLTLFQCRKKIAMSITMGTVYNDNTIANPNTTAAERKVNTLMRITNACFHSDMKDKFIDLNDAKKRADYEKSHGGNPVKEFWVQVSDFTNDTTRNDELGVVLESREDEDDHLQQFVADGAFNLNDFTLQTHISCQQHMSDCMKARENCLKQMRLSGHHSNDLWTYCGNVKFTKLRTSSAPVPAKAIYYCHVLCCKHPDIDGKFATFLSDKLKSDSDVDLSGSADQPEESKSKHKAMDHLFQSITSATNEMSTFFAEKKQQQQQQQQKPNLITVEDESRKRVLWAEYLDLAGKFLAMKQQNAMLPLLGNFAIQIKELEKLCGIPGEQSV
jgi:hypothetical protein